MIPIGDAGSRIAILGWGSLIWNPAEFPHRGGWTAGGPTLPICREHDFEAAIWTALPTTFLERVGREFSVDAGLDYVAGLRGELRRRAGEYIRRAPVATETPLRAAFRADSRPAT